MKSLIACLVLMLAATVNAQGPTGTEYYCCNTPQAPIMQVGFTNIMTCPNPYLHTTTPYTGGGLAWLFVGTIEGSQPWPLDPSVGWLLMDSSSIIATAAMFPDATATAWEHTLNLPAVPALVGDIFMFQACTMGPSLNFALTNGWNTQLVW